MWVVVDKRETNFPYIYKENGKVMWKPIRLAEELKAEEICNAFNMINSKHKYMVIEE